MDYVALQRMATMQIKDKGVAMILKRSTQQYACHGVKVALSATQVDGTNTQMGDFTVLLTTETTTTPRPDDRLQWSGSTLWRRVIGVEPIEPGPVTIAYQLLVRK